MYLRFATGVHASAPLCIVPVRGPMFTRLLHDKKKIMDKKSCHGLYYVVSYSANVFPY